MSESAERVPQSFRRESRLFLWIALLLILFLNFLTLIFFRNAVAWGQEEAERRAAEILRRVALSAARPERLRRGDGAGRHRARRGLHRLLRRERPPARLRSAPGRPKRLASCRGRAPPPAGSSTSGGEKPPLLFSTFSTGQRFYAIAVDPGPAPP